MRCDVGASGIQTPYVNRSESITFGAAIGCARSVTAAIESVLLEFASKCMPCSAINVVAVASPIGEHCRLITSTAEGGRIASNLIIVET